jgi:hypothetical protein
VSQLIKKSVNTILAIGNAFIGLLLLLVMNFRFFFEGLSEVDYPNAPLMNSMVLDIVIRSETGLIFSALLAGIIMKEFTSLALKTKLLINGALFLPFFALLT